MTDSQSTFTFTVNDDAPILVELKPTTGRRQVGRGSMTMEEIATLSRQALNHAMNTVYQMAQHVSATVSALPSKSRPSAVEAEFCLTMDAEGNAFIAKAGAEGSITVKLTWGTPLD